MNLIALSAFTDNYVWLMHDDVDALVVDPGDPHPVVSALSDRNLKLKTILVTHHHADHTGGVQALIDRYQPKVFAAAREPLPSGAQPVAEGDRFDVLGCDVLTLDVPGHTAGHVAFFVTPRGDAPILFCGDTLFSAGCGRLFEGTAAQMHDSLSRLAGLPSQTRVCCAHEYTVSNLRFAHAVEPRNPDVIEYQARSVALRAQGQPTLPSTLGLERRVNPFLRCDDPEVSAVAAARGADAHDPVSVFAALREWKNVFK